MYRNLNKLKLTKDRIRDKFERVEKIFMAKNEFF